MRSDIPYAVLAAIECEPLPPIVNGFITYAPGPDNSANYKLGTIASYTCYSGYFLELSSNSETRTCRDDDGKDAFGKFDGQAPTCVGKCLKAVHCSKLKYKIQKH